MASKRSRRGPQTEMIDNQLFTIILNLLFEKPPSNDHFSLLKIELIKGKTEKHYRRAVTTLTDTIYAWLRAHPDDEDLIDFLSTKLSSAEINQVTEKGEYKELLTAKTLKRTAETSLGTEATISALKAYQYVSKRQHEKERKFRKRMDRVKGLYYQINTHSEFSSRFQESLYWITYNEQNQQYEVWDKHKNQKNEEVTPQLDVVWKSDRHLMLTMGHKTDAEDNILIHYIYIGTSGEMPEFLQSVFIYSNKKGNTVANIALFCRIDLRVNDLAAKSWFSRKLKVDKYKGLSREEAFFREFRAERMLRQLTQRPFLPKLRQKVGPHVSSRTVLQNIQYFLHRRAADPIKTKLYHSEKSFNFSKQLAGDPGPYRQKAHNYLTYANYVGDYYVYFNEGWPSPKAIKPLPLRNRFFSTIGKALMELRIDEVSGAVRCTMHIRKNQDKQDVFVYKGWLQNQRIEDSSLLILNLTLEPSHRTCLNLLLHRVSDYKFIGSYNVAYNANSKIGTGVAVAIREGVINKNNELGQGRRGFNLESKERESPDAFSLTTGHKFSSPLEKQIAYFLANTQQARTMVPDLRSDIEKVTDNIYSGVYHTYSAVKDGKGLQRNLLIVYPHGAAFCWSSENKLMHGMAEVLTAPSRMTILFRTFEDSVQSQQSFLSIRVEDVAPAEGRTYYLGSYSGFESRGYHVPVSAYVVLEFCFDLEDEKFTSLDTFIKDEAWKSKELEGEELDKVPEDVRTFLADPNYVAKRLKRTFYRADQIDQSK